jgi:RHS repeat-associated protein
LFYDQQDSLYLSTYRVLDAMTGRFVNRDPLREKAGINLYTYVNGKPTSAFDASGLCGCPPNNTATFPERWEDAFGRAEGVVNLAEAFNGLRDFFPKAFVSSVALDFAYSKAIVRSYQAGGMYAGRIAAAGATELGGPIIVAFYSDKIVAGIGATVETGASYFEDGTVQNWFSSAEDSILDLFYPPDHNYEQNICPN